MNAEAIKGMAISAISAFNSRQTHSTDEIHHLSPSNMIVVDENTVVFETARERALVSRLFAGVFTVVGRQLKVQAADKYEMRYLEIASETVRRPRPPMTPAKSRKEKARQDGLARKAQNARDVCARKVQSIQQQMFEADAEERGCEP